jgi:1-deoxy-D-xylulose-5-phosphate reductoisomerase
LARHALQLGGANPTILNAANEIAVAAFLAGRIGFLDIVATVEATLGAYRPQVPSSIADVVSIDAEARQQAERLIAAGPGRRGA